MRGRRALGWICLWVFGTRIFLTVWDAWFCGFGALALGFGDRGLGRRQQSRDGIFEYVRLGFGFRGFGLGVRSHINLRV